MSDEKELSKPFDQPVCNGARLRKKRYEVEWLLREGVSKLVIARRLQISPHSVRAVALAMQESGYAAVSGGESVSSANLPALNQPSIKNIPDMLREKAMRLVEGITEEKIMKSSVSALGLAADRFLNRAESLENKSNPLWYADVMKDYGITPSHSISRLTVKQTNEVQVTAEQHSTSDPA